MTEEKEIEYPCDDCGEEKKCIAQGKYRWCKQWRDWFGHQWRALQKKFARDVSERHETEEGDDSERL